MTTQVERNQSGGTEKIAMANIDSITIHQRGDGQYCLIGRLRGRHGYDQMVDVSNDGKARLYDTKHVARARAEVILKRLNG